MSYQQRIQQRLLADNSEGFFSPHFTRLMTALSTKYLLILILFLAAVLRLNHINQPFVDYVDWRQVSTAMMAENFYRTNGNILYPEVNWNGPGPSYQGREFQTITYMAALLYPITGQHDWVGRGLAVLFGLWGIFALYQLVRRVWDETYAIAGAAVMALMPGAIFIERSFIPDPAMVALVVTSCWLWVAYFQTDRRAYFTLALLIGIWGFLTKLPGLVVGLPLLYALLTILKQRGVLTWKRFALLSLAGFVTLVPVVAYYLWARHLSLTYPPYHFAGARNWLWVSGLRQWLAEDYYLPQLYWNLNHWIWTPPVFILVVVGCLLPLLQLGRKPGFGLQAGTAPRAPWIFHWWLLGGIIYYGIGARELVINAWNLHIFNPAAAVLAGYAVVTLAAWARRIGRTPAAWSVIAILSLVIVGYGQRQLQYMYTPHWNAVENYHLGLALHQVSIPGDLVITVPTGFIEPVAIYYSQRRGWSFPPPWPDVTWWAGAGDDDTEAIQLFEELRAQGANWLGFVHARHVAMQETNPDFMAYIESLCEVEQVSADWITYRIPPLVESSVFPTQTTAELSQ